MKFALSVGVVASATLLLTACGGDGDPTNGGTNGTPVATSIALISGDAQTGGRTTALANPLVVEVRDTQGNGVAGVNVDWTKTALSGALSEQVTQTNSQGRASVVYTLGTLPVQDMITASVSGLSGSPVTFTATAQDLGPVTVTVEMSGTAFVAPGGGDMVTVLLGDEIEWVNRDAVLHTATSTSVPAGGAVFASANLATGATFTFTPAVEGIWVYLCLVHPTVMLDARITVLP